MQLNRKMLLGLALLLVFVAAIAAGCANGGEETGEKTKTQSIRFATGDSGSYAYMVSSHLASILNKNLPEGYRVTVHPYGASTATTKAVMVQGEAELALSADIDLEDIVKRQGGFKELKEDAKQLVHTFYAYPMSCFPIIDSRYADEYTSWKDLSGKPFCFLPIGYSTHNRASRTFDLLGYDFNHVEIDTSTLGDAMSAGTIVGGWGVSTAGVSVPSYWTETDIKTDLTVLNPSEEEKAALEAAGLSIIKVDPKNIFSQDVGVDEIEGVPILFGWQGTADLDASFVKSMHEAFYQNADKLVEMEPGFGPMAEDYVNFQVMGIKANPEIPVHQGLAEFLKDHDAWDDACTIAE